LGVLTPGALVADAVGNEGAGELVEVVGVANLGEEVPFGGGVFERAQGRIAACFVEKACLVGAECEDK
jgi:hypothetical protein